MGDSQLTRALLRWFDREARELPWRATKDPYAIWISEVMLQQTQVVTVLPYFGRFLTRLPTVAALARAPLTEVLSLWSGLGYYSRARNLHRAAQVIVSEHRGRLPSSVEALRELPGFGRYTAGAVASIAFGVRAPLVDGNVARVFSRLFAIDAPVGDKAREKRLWELAEQLVPASRPGDFNQALMELGATVCLPANPVCLRCPLRERCEARRQGRVDQLPPPKVRAARRALALEAAVCRKGARLLLMRRSEAGLFGGLWELPSAPAGQLHTLFGKRGVLGERLGVVQRTLTHRDLELVLRSVTVRAPRLPPGYEALKWVSAADLDALGISAATRAALRVLGF